MGEMETAGPQDRPPRRTLVAAAAAALAAAALIPAAPPGLNLFVCAATIATAVVLARPRPASVESISLASAAILLSFTPLLRAAGWVIALTLFYAILLACWAAGGAQTWPQLFKSLLGPSACLPGGFGELAGILENRRGGDAGRSLFRALRAVVFAGGLLLVFGSLFASADAAFAGLAGRLTPDLSIDHWTVIRVGLFIVVFLGTIALALSGPRFGVPVLNKLVDRGLAVVLRDQGGRLQLAWTLSPIEWVPAMILLGVLFTSFVGVQFTVLFGGNEHVLRTTGLSYAEYARQGFAQLILTSALTLGLIGFAALTFGRPLRRHSQLLYGLSGALCLLTLVILASALHRLGLYEEAFGFTRARLMAHGTILWLGALFVMVGLLVAVRKSAWLPSGVVLLGAAAMICLASSNPDRLIARRNVDRFHHGGKLDAPYLSSLSADAVPALDSLPADLRGPIVRSILDRLDPDEPWTSWNLGRARARRVAGTG